MKKILLIISVFILFSCSKDDPKIPYSPIYSTALAYSEAEIGKPSAIELTVTEYFYQGSINIQYQLISGEGKLKNEAGAEITGQIIQDAAKTHNLTFTPSAAGVNILKFTMTDEKGLSNEQEIKIISSAEKIPVKVATYTSHAHRKRGGAFLMDLQGNPNDKFTFRLNNSNVTAIYTHVYNDKEELVRLDFEPGIDYSFYSDTYKISYIKVDGGKITDLDFTITDPTGVSKDFAYSIDVWDDSQLIY